MDTSTELILIRITGLDRPGLIASITEILSKYDVTILDIGQADIHSTLSLGILFKSREKDSGKRKARLCHVRDEPRDGRHEQQDLQPERRQQRRHLRLGLHDLQVHDEAELHRQVLLSGELHAARPRRGHLRDRQLPDQV